MTKHLAPFKLDEINNIIKQASPQQLAWLSGYLWALADNSSFLLSPEYGTLDPTDVPTTIANSTTNITILSASQTGNARSVAQMLYHDIEAFGFPVNHINASDYRFKKISQENILIIVTSTQGDGEPPEEALTFYNGLYSKKPPDLSKLRFAVFGLGDSSYTHFCQAAKDIDLRLAELGAKRLLERIDADTDYQTISKLWCKSVVEQLKDCVALSNTNCVRKTSNKLTHTYSRELPFLATVNINQKITGRNSDRDIRHIELDLTGSAITYQVGDALGVWFENDESLVDELLTITQLAADSQVELEGQQLTLKQALLEKRELTKNTPAIVEKYASLIANKKLLELVKDQSSLVKFCQTTPIIDMLGRYCGSVDAQALINILRPLTPRFYSIASAQDEVGDEVHLTVNIVQYEVDGKCRTGGASGFLARQQAELGQIKIFLEANNNFRLPNDNQAPIIMIAAGTGIAPFRGFMQQRAREASGGKNWLLFGNPHFTDDFLYQLEWQRYLKDGLLSRIDLAWSRDQAEKIYVQDKLLTQGVDIWQWLQDGAYIYVCGDANNMAKAVNSTLLNIIMYHGHYDEAQAIDYLEQLRSDKRYQRDIY